MTLSPSEISKVSKQLNASAPIELELLLSCEDHTVSRETFSLYTNHERDMLVTIPQPTVEKLPDYYESEEYISHTDSNRNLLEKAYQIVRQHSLKRKTKLINRVHGGPGRILDVGCGTGDFLEASERSGWSICGVEPNEKAREIASTKTKHKEYFSTIDQLIESNPETFDLITLWHVLEHIPDLYAFIGKLKSLLNPDGVLIIAVPNFKSSDAKHYGPSWAAYDVPRHLWHFSRTSIERIFSDFGMKVLEELPLMFDSFYVSLLSEKYKTGHGNYIKAFYQGMRSNLDAKQSGEYSSLIYLIK